MWHFRRPLGTPPDDAYELTVALENTPDTADIVEIVL